MVVNLEVSRASFRQEDLIKRLLCTLYALVQSLSISPVIMKNPTVAKDYMTPFDRITILEYDSNFHLFLQHLQVVLSSFQSEPVYITQPFISIQAQEYLSSVTDQCEKESVLKAANNIPRLLSLYHNGKPKAYFTKYVYDYVSSEYDDIFLHVLWQTMANGKSKPYKI